MNMKINELNLKIGQKIKLYVDVAKDGSGSSMGRGVEGVEEHLIDVIWNGEIYDGTMGCVILLNGAHLGLPISANDILAANKFEKQMFN